MLLILLLIIFIISVAGIVVMVVRKFPVLASLHMRDARIENVAKVKRSIIEQRILRRTRSALMTVRRLVLPQVARARACKERIRVWAVDVERRYQENLLKEQHPHASPASAQDLIRAAQTLLEEGKLDQAEEKLLKAIALDQREVPAYKVLARVYTARKEFDHVREIDEFLLRLDPHQADVYADMAHALTTLGNTDLALDAIEKAAVLEDENPKYLDQLLELAILKKKKKLAYETLLRLKEVNPENEKIAVFTARIQELPPEAHA